ncbi:Claudin-1 [Oryzias melastigma]|uniref:Claudin n=1 Tax=Oryzias melastigma TaxID=30732 RepID=A0A834CE61_ORYME|nr:Claudin-1 [Oryzias melastigma]
MANSGLQLLGFTLALLGFIGTIACTIMVEWKASSYAGDNIITAQAMYEGLWQSCVSQSTGQIQCKVFDSILQLPAMVQATRGLMVTSILLCFFAMMVAIFGMECTNCIENGSAAKEKVALVGGVIFIIAGLLALVGTSWYGSRITQEFYNPFTPTNSRYEFGKALYIGWAAAMLILIGGGFLSCSCPKKDTGRPAGRKSHV